MSSINISLKKEAYEFLRSLKNRDKSFSDVVLEFREKNARDDIMNLFGALKDSKIDREARNRNMKEFRKSLNNRITETRRKMEQLRNARIG